MVQSNMPTSISIFCYIYTRIVRIFLKCSLDFMVIVNASLHSTESYFLIFCQSSFIGQILETSVYKHNEICQQHKHAPTK